MFENRKILIINESSNETNQLGAVFQNAKNIVQIANKGYDGIEIAKKFQPDILLIDKELPDLNGLQVCKSIKKKLEFKYSGIILLGDDFKETEVLLGLNYGVDDFFNKPIRNAELFFRMKRVLDFNKQQQQLEETVQKLDEANANLIEDKKRLSKYVSEDLVKKILTGDVSTKFGGTHIQASLMFFDIRNSTSIAEALEPNKFSEIISLLFTDLMDIIYGHKGSVNKLIGDGIFATFGCPISTGQDSFNCTQCAIRMFECLETFNEFRPKYLKNPITAGIGIATGKVFSGNIGSVRRMEYTVLGDAVNIASPKTPENKFIPKPVKPE